MHGKERAHRTYLLVGNVFHCFGYASHPWSRWNLQQQTYTTTEKRLTIAARALSRQVTILRTYRRTGIQQRARHMPCQEWQNDVVKIIKSYLRLTKTCFCVYARCLRQQRRQQLGLPRSSSCQHRPRYRLLLLPRERSTNIQSVRVCDLQLAMPCLLPTSCTRNPEEHYLRSAHSNVDQRIAYANNPSQSAIDRVRQTAAQLRWITDMIAALSEFARSQ